NSIQQNVAIPIVNGKSLIEIIKDLEMNFDKSIAGAYDGIGPRFLKNELTNGSDFDMRKSRILECECGVDGCWPLLMKVTETENDIEWSLFQQYHRDDWDYDDLRFVFNKEEYQKAVNNLK